MLIEKYVTNNAIKGTNTNGTSKYGLNTTGKPKIRGSFILNKPGTNAIFNKDFIC